MKNLHLIFLYTKNEQIKIYKVKNGEINEIIKNKQFGWDKKINNSFLFNNNLNEDQNLTNIKNNIIFKDKETLVKNDNILNVNKNLNKTNVFNYEENAKINNIILSYQINKTSNGIKNYNKSKISNINTNNKSFTFENE